MTETTSPSIEIPKIVVAQGNGLPSVFNMAGFLAMAENGIEPEYFDVAFASSGGAANFAGFASDKALESAWFYPDYLASNEIVDFSRAMKRPPEPIVAINRISELSQKLGLVDEAALLASKTEFNIAVTGPDYHRHFLQPSEGVTHDILHASAAIPTKRLYGVKIEVEGVRYGDGSFSEDGPIPFEPDDERITEPVLIMLNTSIQRVLRASKAAIGRETLTFNGFVPGSDRASIARYSKLLRDDLIRIQAATLDTDRTVVVISPPPDQKPLDPWVRSKDRLIEFGRLGYLETCRVLDFDTALSKNPFHTNRHFRF